MKDSDILDGLEKLMEMTAESMAIIQESVDSQL